MRGETAVFGSRRDSRDFNPLSSCEERHETLGTLIEGENFNPLSSCEERRGSKVSYRRSRNFNPLSSCEERPPSTILNPYFRRFQSTLLMRGETGSTTITAKITVISIHSPHARRDSCLSPSPSHTPNFNPLSSCEERP